MRSKAYLEGSIFYIDTRVQGEDYTCDEAAEYVESIQDDPRAPSGVRIFSRPKSRSKVVRRGRQL